MTLSNNYQPTKVSANGTIVDFGFTWNGLNTSYIRVYLEDKTTGDQTLVESTEYTITAFSESGGNVRFNTAPANTNYVLIAREVNETQETPYKTSLGFNGEDVEASFDKVTGKIQEITEALDRTPTMPLGTETGAEFPVPVPGNLIQGNADSTGWEDAGVSSQDLVDDAESARQSAIAAAASEAAAANSATEASGYADDAEQSAEIAKESFKGDWENDYPDGAATGYSLGNTVVFGANQWWSKVDNNTTTPPVEYNTPSATWQLFVRGAISNDEFVADIQEATFLGTGSQTVFDLTGANAAFKPTNKNQIFAVYIDTDPVAQEEYTITVNGSDHSIITFNTAPPAPVDPDGTYNIIVKGATPKLIEIDTPIGYEDDTILYNDATVADTVTWEGTVRSDDNTVNITSDTPITSPALTGQTAYSQWYLFVGFDNNIDKNVTLEWDTDIDGANLSTITGVKRRIGDNKDVVFPTDGSGNLVKFTRKFGVWEFELWSGSAISGVLTLNNSMLNYSNICFRTDWVPFFNGDFKCMQNDFVNYYLNNPSVNIAVGNASSSSVTQTVGVSFTSVSSITITSSTNLSITKIIGVK